jgi:DivIVA domain-containing protein
MRGRRKDKKKQGNEEKLFDEPVEPRRITPVDIQQKEFRLAMRGYHERDVDEFLDEITEEVARLYAENKRLSEELDSRGTARAEVPDVSGEADAILARARAEAARLVEDAEARAAALAASAGSAAAGPGPTGSAGAGAPGAALAGFLSREKSFLQNLARMMQDHANAMKEDVRRVRAGTSAGTPEPSRRRPEPSHEAWRPPPQSEAFPAPPPASSLREESPPPEQEQPPYFMDEAPRSSRAAEAAEPALGRVDPMEEHTGFGEGGSVVPAEPEPTVGEGQDLDVAPGEPRPSGPFLDEPTGEWTLGEAGLDERDAGELGPADQRDQKDRTPAPMTRWEPRPEEEASGDDRSVKELFWGED